MTTIEIGNKQYKVREAKTDIEKENGLQGIESLPKDQGMLFYFDPPQEVSMWMKNTHIPLDIIYIDNDKEVIAVHKGEPNSEIPITEKDVAYVLEVNQGSNVSIGDELILDEEKSPVMRVLNADGSTQMDLWGGERIFSRKNTVVLIRKAKKADLSKNDRDYMSLGRYMFKCIRIQDNRSPDYVQVPK